MGMAARGFVYAMVGFLALKTAFGLGGKPTDKQGAVQEIQHLPFGRVVLWAVGIGLIGYILWRFAQAVLDLDHRGRDAKALWKRAAALASGLAYAGVSTGALAVAANQPTWRVGSGAGGDASARDWTAWLMAQPFGRWLVGIAAGVVAGIAIYQFYQAITARFTKRLRGGGMTKAQEDWSRYAGRVGHAARGVAFGLIAWFVLKAALESRAAEAGGLAAAFRKLAEQPQGVWLLAAVGFGFVMFGAYSMVEARYRRIGA
jgi:hypothetical protein